MRRYKRDACRSGKIEAKYERKRETGYSLRSFVRDDQVKIFRSIDRRASEKVCFGEFLYVISGATHKIS
jgi:hypothetical protein